jgi:predicted NBD/HSP70 family sugar kinase
VSLLAEELIDEGWLIELGIDPGINHPRGSGRPPTPLVLDQDRLVFFGVEIGPGLATVVMTNLVGKVLAQGAAPVDMSEPARACAQVAALIESEVIRNDLRRRKPMGIGIAVPGAVDDRTGVLRFAPSLGWREVPLLHLLGAVLAKGPAGDLPLYVQNDAGVAALGEFEFGDPSVSEPLLFLGLGTAVGCGVVVNDRLLTGQGGFAGEVGHTILDPLGPRCRCGRRGCAETFVGLRAIAREIVGPSDSVDAQDAASLLASLPPSAFDADLASRDATVKDALARAGDHLGMLMQNLWAAFDPAVIVLGGPSCELGEALLEPARRRLLRYAEEAGLRPPTVRLSRFGRLAHAVGAAAAVIHYQVRPLSDPERASVEANQPDR